LKEHKSIVVKAEELEQAKDVTSTKKPLLRRKTKHILWAEEIIAYWNNSGCRKHLNPDTQIYQSALKDTVLLLKGKHKKLPRYTRKQIKTSVDNFAQAVTDPEFWPRNKSALKKVSLSDFYFNPWHKDERSRSYLEHYYNNPPNPINPLPKELNPKLTKALINIYVEKRLGNVSVVLTNIDNTHFINAANKLTQYFEKNVNRIESMVMLNTNRQKAELFWEAISAGGNTSKITPAWFSSDLSMRRFVEYATANGYFYAENM
jgi:hypothetical protein